MWRGIFRGFYLAAIWWLAFVETPSLQNNTSITPTTR